MNVKMHPVEKCDPFDFRAIYSDKKYALNNMLMRQVGFPAAIPEGDTIISGWNDRDRKRFERACHRFFKNGKGNFESGQRLEGISDRRFIKWAKAALGVNRNVIGARLVRYTNQGGWPVYRVDLYVHKHGNPMPSTFRNNRSAPNINGSMDARKQGMREYMHDIQFGRMFSAPPYHIATEMEAA